MGIQLYHVKSNNAKIVFMKYMDLARVQEKQHCLTLKPGEIHDFDQETRTRYESSINFPLQNKINIFGRNFSRLAKGKQTTHGIVTVLLPDPKISLMSSSLYLFKINLAAFAAHLQAQRRLGEGEDLESEKHKKETDQDSGPGVEE